MLSKVVTGSDEEPLTGSTEVIELVKLEFWCTDLANRNVQSKEIQIA